MLLYPGASGMKVVIEPCGSAKIGEVPPTK